MRGHWGATVASIVVAMVASMLPPTAALAFGRPSLLRFEAEPAFASKGATIDVRSVDPCAPPGGATDAVVRIEYFEVVGGDAVVIHSTSLAVATDGTWQGSIVVSSCGAIDLQASCLAGGVEYADYAAAVLTMLPVDPGYSILSTNANISGFGSGFSVTGLAARTNAVGLAVDPVTGLRYWLAAADGHVAPSPGGTAFGTLEGKQLNQPIVGIAATPTGRGYWLAAADGGVFAFGDAPFLGSLADRPLNRPIVAIAARPLGLGYWLVAADGGVFTFGDADFLGSLADRPLNGPVVAVAATRSGRGYWLAAADGGVFALGDAPFLGGRAGQPLAAAISGIAPDSGGGGYWLAARDGGVFSFGDAPFLGAGAHLPICFCVFGPETPKPGPVVGIAATPVFA
jgi:hypothetical protein